MPALTRDIGMGDRYPSLQPAHAAFDFELTEDEISRLCELDEQWSSLGPAPQYL